jgi:hypothetical protein
LPFKGSNGFRDSLLSLTRKHTVRAKAGGSRDSSTAAPQGGINGKRSRSCNRQRNERRHVKQVGLVPRLPEMGAGRVERLQLDRAESVRQMYGEYGYQKDSDHRDRRERHGGSQKYE